MRMIDVWLNVQHGVPSPYESGQGPENRSRTQWGRSRTSWFFGIFCKEMKFPPSRENGKNIGDGLFYSSKIAVEVKKCPAWAPPVLRDAPAY